jgi:hypothetical protein
LQAPLQQGVVGSHVKPSGKHTAVPQVPAGPLSPNEHVSEQHIAGSLQGKPSGSQAPPPQTPFTHGEPQQSPFALQAAPLGWQGSQVPSPLQMPLQQGTSGSHGKPSGKHVVDVPQVPVPPSAPTEHAPAQHVAASVQGDPSGWHAPQSPASPQMVAQQLAGPSTQGTPSGWHACPHTPLTQASEQQVAVSEQGEPVGTHAGFSAHTPPMQDAVQHWLSAEQLAPVGEQEGAPPPVPPSAVTVV